MTDRDDYYDNDSDEYVFPEDKEDWQSSDYEMMTRDPEDEDEEYDDEFVDEPEYWEEMALRQESEESGCDDCEDAGSDEGRFEPACIRCQLKQGYGIGGAAVDSTEAVEAIAWLLASEYSGQVEAIAAVPAETSLLCDVCRPSESGLLGLGQWRLVRDGQIMTRQLYPNGPVATVGVVSWLMCRGLVDRRIGNNYVALLPAGCKSIPPQSVVVVPMASIAVMAGIRAGMRWIADTPQAPFEQAEWDAVIAGSGFGYSPPASGGVANACEVDDIPF